MLYAMLAGLLVLAASSLAVLRAEARCRGPAPAGAPGPSPRDDLACNGHRCDAEIQEIRFKSGNCSDRSALEYCYTDVSERPFYEPQLCLQHELSRGVRVFFVEVHLHGRRLRACHRYCTVHLLGVEEMLALFAEFLRLNPREVLILWWFPEGDARSIDSAVQRAYHKTGLARYEFVPQQSRWPAIGELVDADTRLVSLADAAARM